jgi:hypothetical protein
MTTQDPAAEKAAVILGAKNFYTWYNVFVSSPDNTGEQYNFIDTSGAHLKLKPAVLDAYLNLYVKTGFVSQDFIQREKTFFQKCEKLWQKEEKDDIPSGMDGDHIQCTQEDMSAIYSKDPAAVQFTAPDQATVTYVLSPEPPAFSLHVFMKKENGKWLYSGNDCDMGVDEKR